MLTAQLEDPLSRVPQEYHEFHNVFSGEKANVLAPHWLYDLKINLEEGAKPFHGLIYSLLPPELTVLREFLEENIKNGFICPSKSPWGSPVLSLALARIYSKIDLEHTYHLVHIAEGDEPKTAF